MKNIIKNWKTSLLGSGALAGGLINYIQDPTSLKESLIMIVVGFIGLLSKDANVTGVVSKEDK